MDVSALVQIRAVRLDDAGEIAAALFESKREMTRWFFTPDTADQATPTPAEQRQRIQEQIRARETRTAFNFTITDSRDGAVLGGCAINHIAWQPGFANVGYWVRASRRGQGIAPEAVRQLAKIGIGELGLNRLELVVDVDNFASIRVAEKAGAQLEGVLRSRVGDSAAPRPARMYSLVREDLEAPVG